MGINMDEDIMLEELYGRMISNLQAYHPAAKNSRTIRRAFETARAAHAGQVRKSGEPFVIHPLEVAIILSELRLDKETIIAALLHDVVEDTLLTTEDIKKEFGEEVMFLVDGVTKLTRMSDSVSKAEMKLESFRKLIMAAAADIRVIIIKLADRLHNMRTLQFQKPEKQLEVAAETMDLYSPIAQRLGISVLSTEMEDLAFSYLFPDEFKQISCKLSNLDQDQEMDRIISEIDRELGNAGFHFKLRNERKHLFSIYRKMVNRQKTLEEMYDIYALKIITNSNRDCYLILGILHYLFNPVPNRFKDYIGIPKENMYQSLHTTLVSKGGRRFEVQIKTKEMDSIAKFGVLAYWKYGESALDAKEISKGQMEKAIWLKQILEWQQDIRNNDEFIDLVKGDFNLFSETISCFTPKGEVKRLQKGSTAVDFAYAIHSDIGDRMTGVFVNSAKKDPDYIIQSGDCVEILTAKDAAGPQKEWLSFVKTSNAKNKIKKHFRESLLQEIGNYEWKESQEAAQSGYMVRLDIYMQKINGFRKFQPISQYFFSGNIDIQEFYYQEKEGVLTALLQVDDKKKLQKMIGELDSLQYIEKVELADTKKGYDNKKTGGNFS